MQRILLTLCFVIYSLVSTAQVKNMHPLSIGDTIPLLSLRSTINNKITRINLHSKLTILDFWNVWCKSCIAAMPRMDSLQRKFANQIQILLVTENKDEVVNQLFKRTSIKRPALAFINNDKILHLLFPHNSVPHHVWIDEHGIVQQITQDLYATNENIEATLEGRQIQLPVKKELADFDPDQSLLVEGKGRMLKHLVSYSFFMNRLSEYGGGRMNMTRDIARQTAGIKIINGSLLSMYKIAFGESLQNSEFDADNRVILEIGNEQSLLSTFTELPESFQKLNNRYCYESLLPFKKQEDLYPMMQNDINVFFDYSAAIRKLKMKCLALVRTTQDDLIHTRENKYPSATTKTDIRLSVRNEPLDKSFMYALTYSNRRMITPIVNNTDYNGNIDLDIRSQLDDLPALRIELKKYGLDLIEVEQEISMLVIKKTN